MTNLTKLSVAGLFILKWTVAFTATPYSSVKAQATHRILTRNMASTATSMLPEYGTPTYGMTKKFPSGVAFDEAVDKVTADLKEHGFGVLTEIDMRATMSKKLDVDLGRPYKILGACNPKLALGALQASPSVGLFLPCNVAVAEDPDGRIVVSVISPKAMFAVADDPGVEPLAKEVQEIMEKVMEGL